MSYTKRQYVNAAFTQLGLSNYTFDLQSEQLQTGLRLLDAMMATWNGKGLLLAYPVPTTPENSDLDEETNVPDRANEAVIYNLALRIAPAFGKQVSPELRQWAHYAYNEILAQAMIPREMALPATMPRGAGNKPQRWEDPFLDKRADPYPPWGE